MAETYELSLCGDCVYMDANGWHEDETGRPLPDPVPLSRLEGISHIGPRTCPACECPEECDVSEGYFSWSACDGCGCTLGGTRYDYIGVSE